MLTVLLFVAAIVLLLADTFEAKIPRINMQSAGLLLIAAAMLIQALTA